MKQHKTPCRECPFRRESPAGYLGNNEAKNFAILANHDGNFPCHLTMGKKQERQCAGRAIMWAKQCKVSRDKSVPSLPVDREKVFSNIYEFNQHHEIEITPEELMGLFPIRT